MDNNHFKLFAVALKMTVEADAFHLRVAKALLSPSPICEHEKQQLRDDVAKRESKHEQLETAVSALIELLRDKPKS